MWLLLMWNLLDVCASFGGMNEYMDLNMEIENK